MFSGSSLIGVMLPAFLAFVISAVAGHFVIPILRSLKAEQTEREEGPASHKKKSGTPNMGGVIFIGAFLIICIIWAFRNPEVIPVAILTVGFGAVGFIDDFIKVQKKRNLGLRAWQKIVLQLLIAISYAAYIINVHGTSLSMKVPFAAGKYVDFGAMNIPFLLFVALAVVNATNLTDGIDGLASSVTAVVAMFFTVTAYLTSSGVAPAGAAMTGALLGFLLYNCNPARVFMGDTGSLALGGFVTGMAYMLQLPLFIPIVGFIYVMEALSVLIQIAYFKATKGKRFFRMAPIHHHFELGGWSETKAVTVFTIITILLACISLLGFWY